jgi:hypothetical protein
MSILEWKYKAVRAVTRAFAASLSAEGQMQPCPEVSQSWPQHIHGSYMAG